MLARVLIALALLAACTPDQPTTPPENWPDVKLPARELAAPDPATPTSDPSATAVATPAPAPASSGDDPIRALAPAPGKDRGLPGPRGGSRGGCEGGTRGVGESWKVDCNECACGDDGQVTCTAMACGYR